MGLADRHYEREDEDGNPPRRQWGSTGMSPTVWVIIVHAVAFVLCMINAPKIQDGLGSHLLFSKSLVLTNHQYWRLLTYFIAENKIVSLVFSMFTLYFVGRMLETVWDWCKLVYSYALFALAGGITATLFVLLFNPSDPQTLLLGASAPVMGLIVAATFRFEGLQGSLPFTNSPFSLKTFLWILIAFIVLTTLLGFNTYTSLAASAGSGLAGYLWVTFVKEERRIYPSKQGWFARFMAQRREKQRQKEAADLQALQTEVDRILDKVRQHRLDSLTEAEKRTLKRATDLQNKKQPTRL
jgi:rhomboid protease GluP